MHSCSCIPSHEVEETEIETLREAVQKLEAEKGDTKEVQQLKAALTAKEKMKEHLTYTYTDSNF